MSLISFKDWRIKESSALTRLRDGWMRGNYPPSASLMSHSTPSPAAMKKIEDELDKPKKKKKKKKKSEGDE